VQCGEPSRLGGMAGPQKSANIRYQQPGRPARLGPFREDLGLVTLRYEQTKQAEPPILLPPPRNPLRALRPYSAVPPRGPVIVPPPIAPPREEHPLFRAQTQSEDEMKRDSGLATATTTASSVTIRAEFEEEFLFEELTKAQLDLELDMEGPRVQPRSKYATIISTLAPSTPPQSPLDKFTVPTRTASPETPTATDASSPRTPTRGGSITRRLGKAFTMGGGSPKAHRLRKRSVSDDRTGIPVIGAHHSCSPPQLGGSAQDGRNDQRISPEARPVVAPLHGEAVSFEPITMQFSADDFFDDLNSLSFSKRGSIMFGGNRVAKLAPSPMSNTSPIMAVPPGNMTHVTTAPEPVQASLEHNVLEFKDEPLAPPLEAIAPAGEVAVGSVSSPPKIRVLPADTERESQKVRSLYQNGDDEEWEDSAQELLPPRLAPTKEVHSDEDDNAVYEFPCKIQFV
jgi:hypothetical protein